MTQYIVRQKGFFLLPVIAIVLLIGVVGYFVYDNYYQNKESVQPFVDTTTPKKSGTERAQHDCISEEQYISKNFNISFTCLPGIEISDSKEALYIGIKGEPYNSIWITNPETTSSYWTTDIIEGLIKTNIGEVYNNPQPIVDKEETLIRVDDERIGGIISYTFEDKSPYEGAPLINYIVPIEDGYLYIQLMSTGLAEGSQFEEDKIYADNLKKILSTFEFEE